MKKNELLRRLPKIDEVLKEESLIVLSEKKGSLLVTEAVRSVISNMRQSILGLEESDLAQLDAAAEHGETGKSALDKFFSQFDTAVVAAAACERLADEEQLNLYPARTRLKMWPEYPEVIQILNTM